MCVLKMFKNYIILLDQYKISIFFFFLSNDSSKKASSTVHNNVQHKNEINSLTTPM